MRTAWNSSAIWLRREFELPEGKHDELRLRIHHDEDAEVFVNGIRIAVFTGYTTEYEEHLLNPSTIGALRPGRNVLAIHCRQTGGGQYIDAGFSRLMPGAPTP